MKISTMTDLLDEYVVQAEHLNNEQIDYVLEGLDLIKRRLELCKSEYNLVLKVLNEKKNRSKKDFVNSFDETIKDVTIGIEETEKIIDQTDNIMKKFLKRTGRNNHEVI